MPTRLFHPQHGYHNAYSNDEIDLMRENGWTDAQDDAQSANSANSEIPGKQEISAASEQQAQIIQRRNRKK